MGRGRILVRWLMVGLAVAGLQALSQGPLPGPPLRHPAQLPGWWAAAGALRAGFALARLVVLLAGSYLLVVGGMALLLTGSGRRPGMTLAKIAHALPGARRLAQATFGVSIAGGIGLASTAAATADVGVAGGVPPAMHLIGPSARVAPPLPAMQAVSRPAGRLAVAPVVVPAPQRRRPSPVAVKRQATPPQTAVWVIRPGDHLWAVAEHTLRVAWGRQPEERAIATYWWRVLELNRPHLPDPSNPDLVFPGDRVVLPSLPPLQG
jgi:hypothetical protein